MSSRTSLDGRLLRRLVHERHKISRNRNPEAFESPDVLRVLREARRLRGLVHAIVQRDDADVFVGVSDDAWRLIVLRGRDGAWEQRSSVDPFQWEVLREDPGVRLRLDGARPCAWEAPGAGFEEVGSEAAAPGSEEDALDADLSLDDA